MDVVSTSFSILKGVTTAFLRKLEQIERLEKHEQKFARQYKRSVGVLAKEAENIKSELSTIMKDGNQVAVSKLLDSNGERRGLNALDELTKSLDSTREFLKNKEEAVSAMLSVLSEGKGSSKILVDVLTVNGRETAFEDKKEEALAILDTYRGDLRRHFDHFHELYDIVLSGVSATTGSYSPHRDATPEERNFIRGEIAFAFDQQPFQLSLAKSVALPAALNIDVSPSASNDPGTYVSLMKEKGESWVTEHLPEPSTVASISDLQSSLLKTLDSNIRVELETAIKRSGTPDDSVSNKKRCEHLEEMHAAISKEMSFIEKKRFSIAFCGMVKAGKSTFINALIGLDLLPTDALPSTAWPCRLLHVEGQQEPVLTIHSEIFQSRVRDLRSKQYGAMLANYNPPEEENRYDALFEGVADGAISMHSHTSDAIREAAEKMQIYRSWADLHENTKNNLRRIETPNFTLPKKAYGVAEVADLLGLMNDIVRLCWRFGVPLEKSSSSPDKWPLIEVEFGALRNENLSGDFEFVDLPGFGEKTNFHAFEDLVREAAKEANAVVPVVSLKEVAENGWRQSLSDVVKTAIGGPPDFVLCTYLDDVPAEPKEKVHDLITEVARAFMIPRDENSMKRILPCATRRGLSSQMLLRMSRETKPNYSDISGEDSPFYDCVKEMLGNSSKIKERQFHRMNFEQWNGALNIQLDKSNLERATNRLVHDLAATLQRRMLAEGNERMRRHARKAILHQYRHLEEMRRSQAAYLRARQEFLEVNEELQRILRGWDLEREKEKAKTTEKLLQGFTRYEGELSKAVDDVVQNTIKDLARAGKLRIVSDHDDAAHLPTTSKTCDVALDSDKLVFKPPRNADFFLDTIKFGVSDELEVAKKNLIDFIRNLANISHTAYFQTLSGKIKISIGDDNLQQQLKDNIIDQLDEKGAGLEALISGFDLVKKNAIRKVVIRHTGTTAFHSIKSSIAKPFTTTRLMPVDTLLNTQGDSQAVKDQDLDSQDLEDKFAELGFMLRAPITVAASVVWVIGAGIWPSRKQSEILFTRKKEFIEQLHKHLFRNFLNQLQEEEKVTLETMMGESWRMARSIVEAQLESEAERYESEGALKGNAPSEDQLIACLAPLLCYLSAESALSQLDSELGKL